MSGTHSLGPGMHMHTLDQLLSRVVERRGFTVQGTDPEALFAKKGDETLLAAWKTDGPLTTADAQLFVSAMDQLHATTGILVAPKGFDQAAKDLVATKGGDVWAESRLVLEVGEAFVHDAISPPIPASAPAAAIGAPGRYPTTPTGPSASAPAPSASAHPTSKFPSLIGQAMTASSSASNHGAAYFMPNKPKGEVPADMQATIQQSRGGSLGYAWGGAMGQASAPGVAQIRSGRHPSRKTDQWGNLLPPDQQPGAATAAAAPALVNEEDVEITTAPRKSAARAGAATVAPAAASARPIVPATDAEGEAYEILTTPKKGPAAPVAAQQAPACNTLRLTLSKEQAMAQTNAKAGAIVKLALVPHVAFEYDLHLERPGIAPVAAHGALLVSSLTGDLRNVDGGLAWADNEPRDARKDQEKLTAVDVYEKVKGHMLKTYSKTMNVEREVAGNTVMETVKIVPDPDEMGLQHRGTVYVPVWEITGGGVNAKVDAFTGVAL